MITANSDYFPGSSEGQQDQRWNRDSDQVAITSCFQAQEITQLRQLAVTLPSISNFIALTAPRDGKEKFRLSNKLILAFREFFNYKTLELDFNQEHPVSIYNKLLSNCENAKAIEAQSTPQSYSDIRDCYRMRSSRKIPENYIILFAQEFRAALVWREYLSDYLASTSK